VIHLAVVVTFDGEVVADVRLAIGSVAPTVVLLPAVADALVGRPLTGPSGRAAIEAAGRAVVAGISPIDDLRAPAAYRLDLAATMTERALTALADGTHRDAWPSDPPRLWFPGFDGRYPTGDAHRASLGPDDPITATVNGRPVTGSGAASEVLLHWLRRHAGTIGVKEGCAEGECGACTVHLDGAAVLACLVPAARAGGAEVTTVEGLADGPSLHVVQEGFVACGAVQCGFCTPGLVMAAAVLLEEREQPDHDQVTAGLAGNLCRCTGYRAIHQAVAAAAAGAERAEAEGR
jgi:aerobic-type carbon monoxide dehydrogenase small subunit (CoxS/CutS family)